MSSVKRQYQALMIDQKRRQDRNVRLLARLENIEKKAAFLQAKTDRIKSLKSIYKKQVNKPGETTKNINVFTSNPSNRVLIERIPVNLTNNYDYNQHDPLQYSNYRYERLYREPNPIYTLKPITLDDAIEEISRRFILVPKQTEHQREPPQNDTKPHLLDDSFGRNENRHSPYETYTRERLSEPYKRDRANEKYNESDETPLHKYDPFETNEMFEANTSEESEDKAKINYSLPQKYNNEVSSKKLDLLGEKYKNHIPDDIVHTLSNDTINESKDDTSEKEQTIEYKTNIKQTESPKLSLNLKLEKIQNDFIVTKDDTLPPQKLEVMKIKPIDIIKDVNTNYSKSNAANDISHNVSEIQEKEYVEEIKHNNQVINKEEIDYNEKDHDAHDNESAFKNEKLTLKNNDYVVPDDDGTNIEKNYHNKSKQDYAEYGENKQYVNSNYNQDPLEETPSHQPAYSEDYTKEKVEQYDESDPNMINENPADYDNELYINDSKPETANEPNQLVYSKDYVEQYGDSDQHVTEFSQNENQIEKDYDQTENYVEQSEHKNEYNEYENYAEESNDQNQVAADYQNENYTEEVDAQYGDTTQNYAEYNQVQEVYPEGYDAAQGEQYIESSETEPKYNPPEQVSNEIIHQNAEIYNAGDEAGVNEEYNIDANQVQYETNQEYYYTNPDGSNNQYEQDPNYIDPNVKDQNNVYYNEGETAQQIQEYETGNQDYLNQDVNNTQVPQYDQEADQLEYNQMNVNENTLGNTEYEQYDLSQQETQNIVYPDADTQNIEQSYQERDPSQYAQEEPVYDETYGQQENVQYDQTLAENTPLQNYAQEPNASVKPLEILESDTDHDRSNIEESSKQESDFDFSLKQ